MKINNLNCLIFSCLITFFFTDCKSQKKEVASQSDSINVLDFGAKGNGVHDDTKSIMRANTLATAKNKTLFFPAGTYSAHGIKITCSWKGENNTIIKANRRVKNPTKDPFCTVNKSSNISINNLIFDGNVTSDPKDWKKGYDQFTGQYPLYILSSNNIKVSSCTFKNAMKCGLRIEDSKNINIERIKINKSRGAFGDGVYVKKSNKIFFDNCDVEDYTRIGFVVEQASFEIYFDNCSAKNGHHGSKLYGHSEYNSGFWFENSGNIFVERCESSYNTDFGYVFSFNKWTQPNYNKLSIVSSKSNFNPLGYKIVSSKMIPIESSVETSQATECNVGFVCNSFNSKDQFHFEKNHVSIRFSDKTKNEIPYMWNIKHDDTNRKSSLDYNDCTIDYLNSKSKNVKSIDTNTADFSCYTCGNAEVKIDNCKNIDQKTAISIKSRTSPTDFKISNSSVEFIAIKKGSEFVLDNVNLDELSKKKIESNLYKLELKEKEK